MGPPGIPPVASTSFHARSGRDARQSVRQRDPTACVRQLAAGRFLTTSLPTRGWTGWGHRVSLRLQARVSRYLPRRRPGSPVSLAVSTSILDRLPVHVNYAEADVLAQVDPNLVLATEPDRRPAETGQIEVCVTDDVPARQLIAQGSQAVPVILDQCARFPSPATSSLFQSPCAICTATRTGSPRRSLSHSRASSLVNVSSPRSARSSRWR